MKKVIIGVISVAIVCVIAVYSYTNIIAKYNFQIKELAETGEETMWTDNSEYNRYDIKFGKLDGSDTKEIISRKSTYDMKINAEAVSGDLNLKIYNNNKVLFDKNGSINKTIKISKDDSKSVKVQLTGNKAKGHVIINLR